MTEISSMYRLQPVFEIPEKLDLPTGFYEMKSPVACVLKPTENEGKEILACIMDKVKDIMKTPVPVLCDLLERRWESILQELEDLKSQISEIRKTTTEACELSGCRIMDAKALSNLKVLNGAVINANPSNPPYSLLLIKHLYKQFLPIVLSAHVHSSVSTLPEELKCFSDSFSENNALKLHLVWKTNIVDTELILNPVKQLPIKGEVNLLRLLAQYGLDLQYPSKEILDTVNTDSILDLCHRLIHIKNVKERASLLKNLNAKIGKSSYFGGNSINIVDVAAWSALKQIKINPSQDLGQNLAKWFPRINNMLP